jgi:hypothetical protein
MDKSAVKHNMLKLVIKFDQSGAATCKFSVDVAILGNNAGV